MGVNIIKPRIRGLIRIAPGETRCKIIIRLRLTTEWLNLQIVNLHYKIQPLRGCKNRNHISHRVSPGAIHIEPLRGLIQYRNHISHRVSPGVIHIEPLRGLIQYRKRKNVLNISTL
jgi:hypothetical protein